MKFKMASGTGSRRCQDPGTQDVMIFLMSKGRICFKVRTVTIQNNFVSLESKHQQDANPNALKYCSSVVGSTQGTGAKGAEDHLLHTHHRGSFIIPSVPLLLLMALSCP